MEHNEQERLHTFYKTYINIINYILFMYEIYKYVYILKYITYIYMDFPHKVVHKFLP